VILRFLRWIKKKFLKTGNIMIFMGVMILSLGMNNAWWQYHINHSVIDMVDTSPQVLDPNIRIKGATVFPPTPTPFQPSTLTPFQPQNEQEALKATSSGGLSDTGLVTSENMEATLSLYSSTRTKFVPDRLIIPAIQLDAPIIPIHYKVIEYESQTLEQWLVPNKFAAGWQDTSAVLGSPGNTVLNGHHNAFGSVFKDVVKLELEDIIKVYSGDDVFTYKVAAKMLFPERYLPIQERITNARWILPSDDVRLTLITCWPPNGNTARVIIVAFPMPE
jgi:LPXTG-site transpeptidase (sortase) family protein